MAPHCLFGQVQTPTHLYTPGPSSLQIGTFFSEQTGSPSLSSRCSSGPARGALQTFPGGHWFRVCEPCFSGLQEVQSEDTALMFLSSCWLGQDRACFQATLSASLVTVLEQKHGLLTGTPPEFHSAGVTAVRLRPAPFNKSAWRQLSSFLLPPWSRGVLCRRKEERFPIT